MSSRQDGEKEENYYTILQCDRMATLDEIKRSYQKLALTLHPDKNPLGDESFQRLQRAWTSLRDPQTRKQYDAELSCREHEDCLLYDSVALTDMTQLSDKVYSYPCRCGGHYLLDLDDITQQIIVIPCDECSFAIQVNVK